MLHVATTKHEGFCHINVVIAVNKLLPNFLATITRTFQGKIKVPWEHNRGTVTLHPFCYLPPTKLGSCSAISPIGIDELPKGGGEQNCDALSEMNCQCVVYYDTHLKI